MQLSIFNSSFKVILQIKSLMIITLFLFIFCVCCVTQKLQTYNLFTSCVKNFDKLLYIVFEVTAALIIL